MSRQQIVNFNMIVIDIETSGLDPQTSGLVSIGAVEFENPNNRFYGECYVPQEKDINEDSLPIIGFTSEQLRDTTRQSPYILLKSFIEWMEPVPDRTPAGLHVGSFDLQFLKQLADELNFDWPLGSRSIDLHTVMYTYLKMNDPNSYLVNNQRSSITGNFIQKYCGLSTVETPHNALTDALWEAECFARLIQKKNLIKEYGDNEIPSYLSATI